MRDFAHSLPMALLKAREAVMAGFRPDLEAHDLTEQQWRVLRVLTEHPGITAGELAERAALLRPSVSRIVGRLEERGLIDRRPGERDLRLARLT
jgi:homoprotocatechuate degradation regulator HpaR